MHFLFGEWKELGPVTKMPLIFHQYGLVDQKLSGNTYQIIYSFFFYYQLEIKPLTCYQSTISRRLISLQTVC